MRNFFLAALIGTGLALPALAQDKDAAPPLSVKSAEVTRLDTVANSDATDWQGEGTTGRITRSFYFLGSGDAGEYKLHF